MSFVGPGDVVTYLVWLEQVQKLGLGDTSTPDIDERKTKKEDGEYTIYFWNGSELKKANRDADLLAGQPGSYYQDASNLNAGTINLARIPDILTGKSADKLDGQEGSYYRNASNLNAGTIPLARIPPLLTGKDVDKLDGQEGSYYLNASNLNAGIVSRGLLGDFWRDINTDETSSPYIQSGTTTVSAGSGTEYVAFDYAYTQTPRVKTGSNSPTQCKIVSISTYGVTFQKHGTVTYVVYWDAIGRRD